MVIGALLLSVLGGAVGPGAVTVQLSDVFAGDSGGSRHPMSDGVLHLQVEDVRFMDRIYSETKHEVAYCTMVSAVREMTPYLADTVTASERSVEFSTVNCPQSSYHEFGVIHTHPSGDSVQLLTDVRSFRQGTYDYTCIQGGQISTEEETQTTGFRCYTHPLSGSSGDDPSEVPVQVTS